MEDSFLSPKNSGDYTRFIETRFIQTRFIETRSIDAFLGSGCPHADARATGGQAEEGAESLSIPRRCWKGENRPQSPTE
jgi:hypothetical protein